MLYKMHGYARRKKEADLLATGRVASLDGSAALIAAFVDSSEMSGVSVGESVVGLTLALHREKCLAS